MLPLSFLALVLALTALAVMAGAMLRLRRVRRLGRLAAQWEMSYAPRDPFHLITRVISQFPVPGAADVNLVDLIYRQEAGWYRYLLTVEYTTGVVRLKRRHRRAISLSESRDPHRAGQTILTPAPRGLSLIEQYRWLHKQLDA